MEYADDRPTDEYHLNFGDHMRRIRGPWIFDEARRREEGMRHELARQRILRFSHPLTGRTEVGHDVDVYFDPGTRRWGASVLHQGDPESRRFTTDLGEDDSQVPRRLREFMGHPNVVGQMAQQYKRALGNGDPTGDHPDERWQEPDEPWDTHLEGPRFELPLENS